MGAKRRRIFSGLVACALGFGAMSVGGVGVASAGEPCTSRATTRPFTAWGDSNKYFIAPGGAFESATTWTGSAISTVLGNETWRINGLLHARSLRIGVAGSATSPQFCVSSDEDSLRLFFKSPGVRGAVLQLHIDVVSGVNRATNDYTIDGASFGWGLTPRIVLPDIRDSGGQQHVTITLTAAGTAATWSIDDVMIDPWKAI